MTELIGLSTFSLLLNVMFFAPLLWPAWPICKRAGLPGPLGLLIFVPLVNIVGIWMFSYMSWPIDRQPAAKA